MKILVTGAKGQVGTEVCRLAEQRKHNCIGLDAAALDITNEQQVLAVVKDHNPDIVVNAAAYTAVDKAESEQTQAYAVNEAGVLYLAKACQHLAVPLLHISTDYVFDGSKAEDYLESDEPNPVSVYGASKLAGEKALRAVHAEHVILRVSWVFGAHGQNFVKTMLKLAQIRDELGVVNDQYGAPTSAMAIARTLIGICEMDQFGEVNFPWGTYHLASSPGVTWYEFALEIFRKANAIGLLTKKIKVNAIGSEQFPTPVKRPANSRLGTEKQDLLPVRLMCHWKQDLEELLKAGATCKLLGG